MKNVIVQIPQNEAISNPLLFLGRSLSQSASQHFSHAAKMQHRSGFAQTPVFQIANDSERGSKKKKNKLSYQKRGEVKAKSTAALIEQASNNPILQGTEDKNQQTAAQLPPRPEKSSARSNVLTTSKKVNMAQDNTLEEDGESNFQKNDRSFVQRQSQLPQQVMDEGAKRKQMLQQRSERIDKHLQRFMKKIGINKLNHQTQAFQDYLQEENSSNAQQQPLSRQVRKNVLPAISYTQQLPPRSSNSRNSAHRTQNSLNQSRQQLLPSQEQQQTNAFEVFMNFCEKEQRNLSKIDSKCNKGIKSSGKTYKSLQQQLRRMEQQNNLLDADENELQLRQFYQK